MERRYNYSGVKPNKQAFYGRLCCWYSKEDAILTWEKWNEIKRKNGVVVNAKPYIATYSRFKEDDTIAEYSWVDITYSKEEARAFRREFNNVIEDLEWTIRQTEDKDCLRELNDKLELTKAELELFNSYNPR